MSLVLPRNAINTISQASDPKRAILDFVGDLSGVELIGDRILIGTYIRPEKTRGGIIRPDSNKDEDVWQGKAGLVLKWGPDAFVNPETGNLYDQVVQEGEWCVFFIGDAKPLHVKGYPCRIVRDTSICMKIKDPEAVL